MTLRIKFVSVLLALLVALSISMLVNAPTAHADVCAQAGITVDGSTPQRQGPCVVLLPEWNVCVQNSGTTTTIPIRHDVYVCVIVPF